MSDDAKKVFLSYRRRTANYFARTIFADLREHGFDVFMDVESLDSGRFPEAILHQIEARPHFIIALTPGSLARMVDEGDWLRRELEHAIEKERNIVPVLGQGFRFDDEAEQSVLARLPTGLARLREFNAVPVYDEYVDNGLERLRTRFLKKAVAAAITPVPLADREWLADLTNKASLFLTPNVDIKPSIGAPTLRVHDVPTFGIIGLGRRKLVWDEVPGASGYVLERSFDEAFTKPYPAYEGDETTHTEYTSFRGLGLTTALRSVLLTSQWYRVRAKSLFGADGPWSNVVRLDPPPEPEKRPLEAPELSEVPEPPWSVAFTASFGGSARLRWTEVAGSAGYVLERSEDDSFLNPTEVYDGEDRSKSDLWPFALPTFNLFMPGHRRFHYRVKAKGGFVFEDSPWSNVVTVEEAPPTQQA